MSEVLDISAISSASSTSSEGSSTPSEGQVVDIQVNGDSNVERTPSVDAGPSMPPQRVAKVYATTAEAIANFKPTPHEVVRGIAPHVFDERKRRRSQKRVPKPYWYMANGEKRSSPLRGATVITWDEHSIYLEQPDMTPKRATSTERSESAPTINAGSSESSEQNRSQRGMINNRRVKLDKSGWKYFRVDIHLLKTIGVKLRLATSLSASTKPRL